MIKKAFTILILISSHSSIYCGNIWGKLYPPSAVEKIGQEINAYMQTIDVTTIRTRSELEERVQTILNKDMRDAKLFPLFNALINQGGFEDDKNIPIRKQLREVMEKVVVGFIDKKSAELKLQ